MFVPLLLVMFRVIRDSEGVVLKPVDATKYGCHPWILFFPQLILFQIRFLRHVLTYYYAPYRWLHHIVGTK